MEDRIAAGWKAPEFELNTFDGKPVRLADYKDQSHVLLVLNRGMF